MCAEVCHGGHKLVNRRVSKAAFCDCGQKGAQTLAQIDIDPSDIASEVVSRRYISFALRYFQFIGSIIGYPFSCFHNFRSSSMWQCLALSESKVDKLSVSVED